jgi:hypothetical protein
VNQLCPLLRCVLRCFICVSSSDSHYQRMDNASRHFLRSEPSHVPSRRGTENPFYRNDVSGQFSVRLGSDPGVDSYSGTHSHPRFGDGIEAPLDAFGRSTLSLQTPLLINPPDKELLAQIPQERQQQATQGRSRITLPPLHDGYVVPDWQSQAIRGCCVLIFRD